MLTSVSLLLIIYLLLLLCRLSCEREDQSQCQHQVPDNIIISRHCIFFSWLSLLLISTLRFLGKSMLYTAQCSDLQMKFLSFSTKQKIKIHILATAWYSHGKKDKDPYNISTIEMESKGCKVMVRQTLRTITLCRFRTWATHKWFDSA